MKANKLRLNKTLLTELYLKACQKKRAFRKRQKFYLLSPMRKFRVSSNAAFDVVATLPVPTQVDGVRVHVNVHKVVDNLTLDVVLHPVYQKTPAYIHHLDERQIPGSVYKQREKQTNQKPPGGYSLQCYCIPKWKMPR